MENQITFKPSNKTLAKMQVVHLGKILFNLQFLALAVMTASVLSFLLPAIYYLILIAISLLTVFTIYVTNPNFASYWSGGEKLTRLAEIMAQSWKYTVPIVLVLAALSITCLIFDKSQKHTAKIIVSVVIAVLAAIVLILKIINGGSILWKPFI